MPRFFGSRRSEKSDDWNRLLLRARRERPRRRSPYCNHELPPPHLITSSASESSLSGMVRPRALAVLRLITNSNFVGC